MTASGPGAGRCAAGARRRPRRRRPRRGAPARGGRGGSGRRAHGATRGRAVDREGPLHLVGAGRERLVAGVVDARRAVVCRRDRASCVAVERRPQHERRLARASPPGTARASRAMRTGPVSVTRTGRHMPPGFQSGSRQSQCWNTPVMLRLAVRSDGGVHVTSTARWCSLARPQRIGDLEGVGGEVALRVAEVAAVEPHVALVEEPVEGQPRAAVIRRAAASVNDRR